MSGDSVTEFRLRREQAYHEPAALGHPEKVARMNPDAALEQRQNRLLVGRDRRNPQHRIPTAFDLQPLGGFDGLDGLIEHGKVRGDALANLFLDRCSPFEPGRHR